MKLTVTTLWSATCGDDWCPFGQGFDVRLWPDRLEKPLSWRKPRRVFVNSMSDLFHDQVPTEFIARVFATMALSSRHTYQLLTKRAARMRAVMSSEDFREAVAEHGAPPLREEIVRPQRTIEGNGEYPLLSTLNI